MIVPIIIVIIISSIIIIVILIVIVVIHIIHIRIDYACDTFQDMSFGCTLNTKRVQPRRGSLGVCLTSVP